MAQEIVEGLLQFRHAMHASTNGSYTDGSYTDGVKKVK